MTALFKVIQPSGLLDGIHAKQLRHQISDYVASGVDIVLIDFQDITHLDSSGLGGLIAIQRVVRTANSQLYLCSINNQAKMLFELTKMEQVFQIFANQQDFHASIALKA